MASPSPVASNDLRLAIRLQLAEFGGNDDSSDSLFDIPLPSLPEAPDIQDAASSRELSNKEQSLARDVAFALELAQLEQGHVRSSTPGAGPSTRPRLGGSPSARGASSFLPPVRTTVRVTVSPFACGICLEPKPGVDQFAPAECGHAFCKACMRKHLIVIATSKRQFPITCPACRGAREQRALLDPQTCLKELAGTGKPYEAFERLLLEEQFVKRLCYCANKACSVPFDFLEIQNFPGPHATQHKVSCPLCGTDTCVKCKVEWHEGRSCSQFRAETNSDGLLRKLAKKKKWKACPKCHALIERNQGCNDMVCRCGCSFCYGCGKDLNACGCH